MRLLTTTSGWACAARLVLVAAFAALVAFAGVFTLPPLDRDEARFAQATAQMLETGDFIAIRFQEDERNKKPAGIHWMQAASVAAFSSVEAREIWAYRLPSVLGAIIAVAFTYAAAARLYGPAPALLAAVLLASAPAVAGEATIAKTDAMLLGLVAAAQAAFIHVFSAVADRRKSSPPPRFIFWPFVFWTAIGGGVLVKGPIILMIVGLTGVVMFIRRPRLDWVFALRPATGAIILMLMIVPWALAIDRATQGRFFAEAIGGDMLAKLGDAKERHGGPPGYYAVLVFALFWPAAALIAPAIRQAIATRKSWPSAFLIGWIAPSWIVFEATATKLPHYALPLYPAIAMLAARAAMAGSAARWDALRGLGAAIYVGIGFMFAALIAFLPVHYRAAPVATYGFVFAASVALASLAVGALFWRRRTAQAGLAAAFLSASVAWTLMAGVLPHLDRLALSPRLASAVAGAGLSPLRDGAPPAILSGYYEPSAIFLLGSKTALVDGARAADLLARDGGAAIVEGREEEAFLARVHEIGAIVERFAKIEGVNYSNGRDVVLGVWRRGDKLEDDRDDQAR
jgi:4-amino-4-deoxy-L-arabinose transferase-like glycosyltransferase